MRIKLKMKNGRKSERTLLDKNLWSIILNDIYMVGGLSFKSYKYLSLYVDGKEIPKTCWMRD